MTDQPQPRTLYVLVDYTDTTGTHQRGEAVQFAPDDREANALLHRGVLSPRPVRRQAGETKQ
jgi:hypothetical protein